MRNIKQVLIYLPAGSTGFDRRDLENLFEEQMTFPELKDLMEAQSIKAMLWMDFCTMAFGEPSEWRNISNLSDFIDYCNDEGYDGDDEDDNDGDPNYYGLSKEALEFLQDKFITIVNVVQDETTNFILDSDGNALEITDLDAAIKQAKLFVSYGTKDPSECRDGASEAEIEFGVKLHKYWSSILTALENMK